jgi:GntR family transcriptional regulator, rspAB operon transcriptional repressor
MVVCGSLGWAGPGDGVDADGGNGAMTVDVERHGQALSSRRSRDSSARGQVYRLLLRDIVRCAAKPGQPLSEKDVAATLGVSRTPVREAFLQLAEEGLLVISPQRGTAVARISTRQVRQAQFIREALERAVLAVSCQNARADRAGLAGLAELDTALYWQRQAVARDDYAAFYEADEFFHAELARRSGLDEVGRVAGGARVHLNRVRWLSLPERGGVDAAITQHAQIASAVAAGDTRRADEVLTAHLRTVLDALPAIRQRFPGYFDPDDENLPPLPDTAGLTVGWRAGQE